MIAEIEKDSKSRVVQWRHGLRCGGPLLWPASRLAEELARERPPHPRATRPCSATRAARARSGALHSSNREHGWRNHHDCLGPRRHRRARRAALRGQPRQPREQRLHRPPRHDDDGTWTSCPCPRFCFGLFFRRGAGSQPTPGAGHCHTGLLGRRLAPAPPQIRIADLGKKVALFFIPGAFTPTCSVSHLPGFIAHFDRIKAAGVDAVVCASVNDP